MSNQSILLLIVVLQAHKTEDEKYAEQKAELHQDIAKLREKVNLNTKAVYSYRHILSCCLL